MCDIMLFGKSFHNSIDEFSIRKYKFGCTREITRSSNASQILVPVADLNALYSTYFVNKS